MVLSKSLYLKVWTTVNMLPRSSANTAHSKNVKDYVAGRESLTTGMNAKKATMITAVSSSLVLVSPLVSEK